ncbi:MULTISPECIES: peptide chain release factor 2 [Amylolactobacillus]
MEISDLNRTLTEINTKLNTLGGLFDLDALNEAIAINEQKMAEPEFWNDNNEAQQVIDETNQLRQKHDSFHELQEAYDEAAVSLEILREEYDTEIAQGLERDLTDLTAKMKSYELNLLLAGEYDKHNALLEIHPGAGGTESQDWGSMLMRMYQRWSEQHGFTFEVTNYEPGDEAGVKSVSVIIKGENAFGLLKSEHGVHRLVRISPFDSAKRRHTSFCSIEITPEIDDTITVDINPDDLRVDVFRSSGAGGQHINKTSSAVRITHLPTGIVVSSQAQRSQFQNRDTAMSMLRAKLFRLEEQKKAAEKAKLVGEQMDIGWGSQIRSYVFHPYTMVKDHRTNYETSNGNAVMDGDLDPFIYAYLQWLLSQENPN